MTLKYFDFSNNFWPFEADKVMKMQENWKRGFPKILELFFTPENNPPKVWNSKMGLKGHFFGTPCK